MSSLAAMTMLRINRYTHLGTCVNKFHTSCTIYLDQRWRQMKGLVANPNKVGPLVNLPDYSFKDNRPVPYGSRQLKRIQKHQEFVKRIVKLVGEVDHAVERHAKLTKEKEDRKQQILDNKLKAKGQKLITST
ncbi:39S ribosomal protein L52, mitochondrial [Anthophora quadrimaculata]